MVGGDMFIEVLGVGWKDEIGEMVEIVVVFKMNVIEKIGLECE